MKEIREGLLLEVLVKPNAMKNSVSIEGELLVVGTREKAEQGRANISVIKIISKFFGVPSTSVIILRGMSSKSKSILVKGIRHGDFIALKMKNFRETVQDNLK